MPREVKAYLCVHRCGRRACCSRESVERHEATCFFNPARRSCKTCEWESTEDDDGWSQPYRICLAPVTQRSDDGYDALDEFNASTDDSRSRIAVNCKHWEPDHHRFPNGVDVPPWEPLPAPEERIPF